MRSAGPYAFARRPRWLASHAALLAVCALFVAAGIWQLDRLDERRERNELVRERRSADERPLPAPGTPDTAHRRVRAVGRYDATGELVLRGRSLDDRPGNHVLTPLVLDDGTAILVDRGWVPPGLEDPPVRDAAPPAGRVTVHGVLVPSEGSGPLQRTDPRAGAITRIDVAAVDRASPLDLRDAYLLLGAQSPSQPGRLPTPAPLPSLDEGPHLLYAIQWFCFVAIAVATYAGILRREATRSSAGSPAPAPG